MFAVAMFAATHFCPSAAGAGYVNYFGEEGTEWTVKHCDPFLPGIPYKEYTVHMWLEGEAEMMGRDALKLWSSTEGSEVVTLVTHVAVEGGKVFFLQQDGIGWFLAYDFDLVPGESAVIYGTSIGMGTEDDRLKPVNVMCMAEGEVDHAPDLEMMDIAFVYDDVPAETVNERWIRGIGSVCGVLQNDFCQYVGIGGALLTEVRSHGETVYRNDDWAWVARVPAMPAVRVGKGSIEVDSGSCPEVYSICGERMAGTAGNFPDLPAGVYVVVAGGTPKKVMVP